MLSGGFDTSIIAHLAAQQSRSYCLTVAFRNARAPGIYYARAIAKKLKMEWELSELSTAQLEERLADVMRILKTFDPMEVRNNVAVCHALASAKALGFSKVMTGAGADELFAGYSFAFNLDSRTMTQSLRQLWSVMRFSSRPMASALGISASLPYLDPNVAGFAKTLKPHHLVGVRNGRRHGKLIPRLAFEELLGRRSAWSVKTPIEYGSGTTVLHHRFPKRTGGESLSRCQRDISSRDGVKIRNWEHLGYYKLYRASFPPPREDARTNWRCPDSGSDIWPQSTFCATCGAYPITPISP